MSHDFVHRGVEILVGDCLDRLKDMPDESVDCCVTSPPYWGLRQYGDEKKQLGMENTPEEFVENLVIVFREVRRVLKPTGSLWLNLGDTYYGGKGRSGAGTAETHESRTSPTLQKEHSYLGVKGESRPHARPHPVLKSKDLCLIPHRVAIALQADGWWLRQDLVWAKPNCMPESVKDRCTRNHEYLFLLTKSKHYFFDSEAIKEKAVNQKQSGRNMTDTRTTYGPQNGGNSGLRDLRKEGLPTHRNKRSVWWIPPRPFGGAHFAVFPPELIEPCILAGTSAKGCCSDCGSPWKRTVGKSCSECGGFVPSQANQCPHCEHRNTDWREGRTVSEPHRSDDFGESGRRVPRRNKIDNKTTISTWDTTCDCDAELIPAVVLDPFGGSGTVAGVAIKHDRRATLIELNSDYAKLMPKRIDSIASQQNIRDAEHERVVGKTSFDEWFA